MVSSVAGLGCCGLGWGLCVVCWEGRSRVFVGVSSLKRKRFGDGDCPVAQDRDAVWWISALYGPGGNEAPTVAPPRRCEGFVCSLRFFAQVNNPSSPETGIGWV